MDISDALLLIEQMPLHEKVAAINAIKRQLHEISPFKDEPVDCVIWIPSDNVTANEYNPNKVAPPEMELLEVSIVNDGYTQPIVTWENGNAHEVVDGFHRSRVGKESKLVAQRVQGYLPVVEIRKEQQGKNDRIASTIRHNRARVKQSERGHVARAVMRSCWKRIRNKIGWSGFAVRKNQGARDAVTQRVAASCG